jgi:hypothetical protein
MMGKDEAQGWIRRLNDEHAGDHDGGYALVEALKRASEEVGPESRARFAAALADFVRVQDEQLWAVALEALVQLGESQEVASLGNEITTSTRDDKWKDYIALGLLRLGQRQFREPILEHVRASLGTPRHLTVPIVAALSRIDRDTCLEISGKYFADAHSRGRSDDVEGFVPAFVRNFVSVDEQLLSELVRTVVAREPEAGRWVARALSDYVSKPWMLQELGEERSARIRAEIAAAANGVN